MNKVKSKKEFETKKAYFETKTIFWVKKQSIMGSIVGYVIFIGMKVYKWNEHINMIVEVGSESNRKGV